MDTEEKIAGEISDEPLYYWRQAKNYYIEGLDVKSEVKPLLNYYCCLNTVKCLLSRNGTTVSNIAHGGNSGITLRQLEHHYSSIKKATRLIDEVIMRPRHYK